MMPLWTSLEWYDWVKFSKHIRQRLTLMTNPWKCHSCDWFPLLLTCACTTHGGISFLLACRDLGGRFDDSFSTCTFFLKWRSAGTHQFHFSGQDQSTVAQWAEMTTAEFPEVLQVSSFSTVIGFHTMLGQHSQLTPTSLGQRWLHV